MAKKKKKDDNPAVNDAYTGMLTVSLIALIVGIILVSVDFSEYYGVDVPKYRPVLPAQKAPPDVKIDVPKTDDKKAEDKKEEEKKGEEKKEEEKK